MLPYPAALPIGPTRRRYGAPVPSEVSRSVDVAAPAERVWALVADLPAMGRLSPENTGGRWLGGASGPAPGARFRGTNRQGRRRWSTTAQVTDCAPGERFAFRVSSVGLPVATWSYTLTPTGPDSCRVTETWTDARGRLIRTLGGWLTGVADRTGYTAVSIEQTLQALRTLLEGPDGAPAQAAPG